MGTAQLPPPVAPTTRTDLLSSQRQREVEAQGKVNMIPHGNVHGTLPRLVLESNEMVIDEPSSENWAFRRRGTGGSCSLPNTTKLSIEEAKDGYCTVYSPVEEPEMTIRYQYVPEGSACNEERICSAARPLLLATEKLFGENETRLELETIFTTIA